MKAPIIDTSDNRKEYDIVVIGSGPAGYVAAIRAGQLGKKVAIIEKNKIGGMCLNWGCIPSKSMIESAKLYQKILNDAQKFGIGGIDKKQVIFEYPKAIQRANSIVRRLSKGVEFLLQKNKVEIVIGEASIIDGNSVSVENRLLTTENILIATGSYFEPLFNNEKEKNIKSFFELNDIPEKIIIYGFDAPSVELAQMLAMIGKTVTLVVPNNKILPMSDNYLSTYSEKMLKKENVRIILNAFKNNIKEENNGLVIGGEFVEYDMLVNLSNRQAILPKSELNFDKENGFLKTNDDLQTSIPSVYAIGDVNGKSRFAHISSAQGLFVVNKICGIDKKLEIEKYPLNMYTHPEIAQIGKTEQQLQDENIEYKISDFSLNSNGKALAEGNNEGIIRILSEKKYGEVLGVQIIADNATDLISEAAAYMQLESTIYDIANTVHAHPTISEAFMEAGFEGVDFAIHK